MYCHLKTAIKSTFTRITLVTCLLACQLVLTGCPTTSIINPKPDTQSSNSRVNELLAAARYASDNERISNYLQATNLLHEAGQLQRATSVLAYIDPQTVPIELTGSYKLTKADNYVRLNDTTASIRIIDSISNQELSYLTQPQHIRLAKLKAKQYYLTGDYIDSADALIFISPLLAENEKQSNHDQIWQTLMLLETASIQTTLPKASHELRGWLELIIAIKESMIPNQQADIYSSWRERWPTHPATRIPPQAMSQLNVLTTHSAKHIAVLLPLTGQYQTVGNAIKNGMLLAHFDAQARGISSPKLQFHDTNTSTHMSDLYQQLLQQGAEFIIGPVTKEKVIELNQQPSFSTPILVLNQDSQLSNTENFYQFGLSSENEAKLVATKASEQGYYNAAVLFPDSDWGKRMFNAFQQKWLAYGNPIVSTASYPSQKHLYTNSVKQLLLPNGQNLEPSALKKRRINSRNQRRQDIDFIFVIANPGSMRQIKPTLNYYYADNLPVLTTSHAIEVSKQLTADQDLNGLEFCDMPWILQNDISLKKQLHSIDSDLSSAVERLYALGVDSYYLHSLLTAGDAYNSVRFDGMTGQLEVTSDGKITRNLHWAKISNGKSRVTGN